MNQREPRLHSALDILTEGIICFAMLFAPWAFGTTEAWSVWFMNGLGYLAGALLAAKRLIRWSTGWRPSRWDDWADAKKNKGARFVSNTLGILTILIIAYCAVHAMNARAIYWSEESQFEYLTCISWLPHSYNRPATWGYLCNYTALALFFWTVRDWMLTKSKDERKFEIAGSYLPERLRRLLWVLCINGGLLAVEGLIQRLSTNKLLWVAEPVINKAPESQFGPYAYRSNGAQVLNLIWPVAAGFWFVLNREARRLNMRRKNYHVILACALLMIVAVILSLSRGALIVAICCITLMALVVLKSINGSNWKTKLGFGIILAASPLLLSGPWAYRFQSAGEDIQIDRVVAWKNAWQIVPDYLWFGTGPGTFSTVYQLAPGALPGNWFGQLHNDWLESLITWGSIGFAMIFAAFALCAGRWFFRAGIPTLPVIFLSYCIAIAGCLLHAFADFPLQIYSILFLFLLHCSVLSCIARPNSRSVC